MKLLTLTLFSSLPLFASANGFNFVPHVPLFSQTAEYISAQVSTPTKTNLCMVDTGARYTIGKDTLFGDLEKIGEEKGGGLSNMNLPTDLVQTDVVVGDWTLSNAVFGRTERIPYECLIGNDFFIGRAFTLDFKSNKISEIENPLPLDSSPDNSLDNELKVYLSKRGGHFGFAVQVAHYSTQSLFDTGASHTVVDQKIVASHPTEFKFIKDLSATDGNGVKIKAILYQLKRFKFGSVELKNIQVIAVDLAALTEKIPTVDVVFGLDIIQNYNWMIDTKSKTWNYEIKK